MKPSPPLAHLHEFTDKGNDVLRSIGYDNDIGRYTIGIVVLIFGIMQYMCFRLNRIRPRHTGARAGNQQDAELLDEALPNIQH